MNFEPLPSWDGNGRLSLPITVIILPRFRHHYSILSVNDLIFCPIQQLSALAHGDGGSPVSGARYAQERILDDKSHERNSAKAQKHLYVGVIPLP